MALRAVRRVSSQQEKGLLDGRLRRMTRRRTQWFSPLLAGVALAANVMAVLYRPCKPKPRLHRSPPR
jgi:hypothetical protein